MRPTSQRKLTISLSAIQQAASEPVYRRGVQYYRRKKVLKYDENQVGDQIEALVIGSEPQPYKVVVTISDSDNFKAECSCPYFEELCKHSIAVLLTHIARIAPGTRFDLVEQESVKEHGQEKASKAKDLLDDPKLIASAPAVNSDDEGNKALLDAMSDQSNALPTTALETAHPDVTLGMLVLEKPLALIIGVIPDLPQGKVNILKVPSEMMNTFPAGSRMFRLIKYLTSLLQTTKGTAGGHRIPRGEEGIVIGHLSLCCQLVNTLNNEKMSFSHEVIKPQTILSENENGELLLKLAALKSDDSVLEHAVYFMGSSSWVLSGNVFYPVDLSPIHRLFPYFDSYGQMTIKLDIVPKFLSVDLPVLMKRMAVRLDDTSAPIPVAITELPQVVIKLVEKQRANKDTVESKSKEEPQLELSLGFRYGDLVLPSRDETTAVESEVYTRTISPNGQSVWVKRAWAQEGEVRRFLNNLQPERVLVDRFFFVGEPALDAVYYLSSPQCVDWEVSGLENLNTYRVSKEGLNLEAKLSLTADSYKFDLDLLCSANKEVVPFANVVESLFRNRNYVKPNAGDHVRLEAATLLSLLKLIGQSQEKSRPLYQALLVLHALESHGVHIQSDKGFSEFVEKIYNFRSLPALDISKGFSGQLREYQQEGCNWLGFLREYGLAGILADDMGLGKTIQTLALLLTHHKNGQTKRAPSLVVAPTSVVYNWLSEAEKFTPGISTALFLGRDRSEILTRLSPDNPRCPDVVFTTYGIIRRDYETLKKHQFEFLVLDEAQNIKNPESVGALGCKSLKAFHRLALSGTPVENRLRELWSLFDFLMPEFLGANKDFTDTYEKPIEAGIPGAGQKLKKIVSPFILRRLKSQVEKELPDRTDIINLCELEDDQRALYLDVLDECRQKVFSEIASHGLARSQISVLTALLRLRQVCCDPRLVKNPPAASLRTERTGATSAKTYQAKNDDNGQSPKNGNGGPARPDMGSAKLTALLAMIGEVVEEGHKILVFSQFVEMLSIIKKELEAAGYTYEYIDGQVPAKDRLDRVNRFNADPSIPIFLISLKAGGTGLNLTGADYVIHYDPWWNPAVENQATDRAHRIGQTRHVFNYKLITRGTVEEKIIALQKKKKELAELVLGAGDESIAKELTKEDLEFLFSF